MQFTYHIDEQDALTAQIFVYAQTPAYFKSRKTFRLWVPMIFIIAGLAHYFLEKSFEVPILFGALAIVAFSIHSFLIKKQFRKYVRNHMQDVLNVEIDANVAQQQLDIKTDENETSFPSSEFESVVVIPQYLYLKLRNGATLIFPENKISNYQELKFYFKEKSCVWDIPYKEMMDWKF